MGQPPDDASALEINFAESLEKFHFCHGDDTFSSVSVGLFVRSSIDQGKEAIIFAVTELFKEIFQHLHQKLM